MNIKTRTCLQKGVSRFTRVSALGVSLGLAACAAAKLLWETTYVSDNQAAQYVTSVIVDIEGNRYVSGARQTYWGAMGGESFAGFDPYISKTDGEGNLIWQTLLPTSYERASPRAGNISNSFTFSQMSDYSGGEEVVAVVQVDQAIYALAQVLGSNFNHSGTGDDSNLSNRDWDVKLYQLGLDGELIWERTLAQSTLKETPKTLKVSPNGGVLVLLERYVERQVIISKVSSAGDIGWTKTIEGADSALGVSESSILVSYGAELSSDAIIAGGGYITSAIELNLEGGVNWFYEAEIEQGGAVESMAVQPRCSGDVGFKFDSKANDVVNVNGNWLVASSNAGYVIACEYFGLFGSDQLAVFNRSGEVIASRVLRERAPRSEIDEMAAAYTGPVGAVSWLKQYSTYSDHVRFVTDDESIYVVGNLSRVSYFDASSYQFPIVFSDILISKVTPDYQVEWTKKLHTTIAKTDNSVSVASQRIAGAKLLNGDLLLASHVIKAEYNDLAEGMFGMPEVTGFYSRVHRFDIGGKRKTLATLDSVLTRDLALYNGEFTLASDEALALGLNHQDSFVYSDYGLVSGAIDQPASYLHNYE